MSDFTIQRARELWDSFPAIRHAFADLGAFAQTLPPTDSTYQAQRDLIERRCIDGAARLAFTRNPAFSKAPPNFVERIGNRLTLWLYGEIGEGALEASAIFEAIRANRDAAAVILRVSSHGGRAHAGERIAAELIRFRGRTVAIVDHFACSAAAHVVAVCDVALMRANAVLMLHYASATLTGDAEFYRAASNHLSNSDRMMERHVLSRRRCDRDAVLNAMKHEQYLGAEDALRIGLIDRITRPIVGADQFIEKESFHA